MRSRMTAPTIGVLTSVVLAVAAMVEQAPANRGDTDWPMFRHDAAGTGYSPLTQITLNNVSTLTQVWTYRLQNAASAPPTGRGGAGGLSSEATQERIARDFR